MVEDSPPSERTIDHEKIRAWAGERDGKPARAKNTGSAPNQAHNGLLRLDFGEPETSLEPISWEEFFEIFDENELTFLYEEKTRDGNISRFFKFVRRENGDK